MISTGCSWAWNVRWGMAAALALAMWTGVADAQPQRFSIDTRMCVGDSLQSDCEIGLGCGTGGLGQCLATHGGDRICLPPRSLICCNSADDCPTLGLADPPVCATIAGVGSGLCRQGTAEYCPDMGAPSVEGTIDCHTSPDGDLVPFAEGDCDSDGVDNATEQAAGTDHCVAGSPRGISIGDTCEPLPTGCLAGAACVVYMAITGTCTRVELNAITVCLPDEPDEVLFCGGAFYCDAGQTEVAISGEDYCVPTVCTDPALDIDLRDCLTDPDTDGEVPFGGGDCDLDGIKNRDERDATSVCVPEPMGVDAGPPPADAGEIDAGPIAPLDAGAGFDAGRTVDNPVFGGGGCRCRASAPTPASPGTYGVFALGLAALIFRRRRRS